MLGSCSWSSIAPLPNVATSSRDGTFVFYSTATVEQTAGAGAGVHTDTTNWTLRLHNETATLTMTEPRATTPLVLEGTGDASNGGLPRLFHQVDGAKTAGFREYPAGIGLTCAVTEVPVHRRGATFRYRCGGFTPYDGGWSDQPVPMEAIKCTVGKEYAGEPLVILFAKAPVEKLYLVCAEHDVVGDLDAGYRLAGS